MSTPFASSPGHDARGVSYRVRRKLRTVVKEARQRLAPRPVRLHVFVAGMQRSGTNMLMDLLDASYATQVFHETDPRAFLTYEMRDRAVIRDLARSCRAPVLVVKALCELDLLTSLMADFAPAKTLWVVRGWRDSVNSALHSFGRFVPQWERLAHERESGDWRGRGMSEATRGLLQALFRRDATEADGAAIMWYYRNILFFEQAFERDPRVRVVFYDSLVRHPVEEMQDVLRFVGIGDLPAGLPGQVRASSASRRTPPAVAADVQALCDDLFSRFAKLRERQSP